MKKIFLISTLLLSLNSFAKVNNPQINLEVEKFQLDNGLTVLLYEDHSSPMISYQTLFKVGSKDEEINYTGIAHLFEHMMFKGTKKFSGKDFETLLKKNGIQNNAYTTRDYTLYYEILPSSKLELVMDIESDRMQGLILNDEMLKKEREVVKEERRYRVDNNVRGLMNEVNYSTIFKKHNYRWPIIGWMKDLNNITTEKCKEFYNKYYAPNNAILIIGGDFDSSQVRKMVKQYYSSIPSSKIQRQEQVQELAQSAQRNIIVSKKVQSDLVFVSFKVSEAGTEDSYALDIAKYILGGTQASRLFKRLQYNEQSVSSVGAYNSTMKDHGIFTVYAQAKPDVSSEGIKKSLFAEIYKLRKYEVSERELVMAKNQMLSSYLASLKTIHGKTSSIAINEYYYNDWSYLMKDMEKYTAVTAKQIKDAAEKYLKPNQRTIVEAKVNVKGEEQ